MIRRLSIFALLLLPMAAHATVTNTATSVSFTCTGSAGPFAFTFPVISPSALVVTQNGTVLTVTSQYTIAPVNNSYSNGGTVTLVSACASGTLVLSRNTPLTQTTHYYQNMPALYSNFEQNLDQLTEITQEIAGNYCSMLNPAGCSLMGPLTVSEDSCSDSIPYLLYNGRCGTGATFIPPTGGAFTVPITAPNVNGVFYVGSAPSQYAHISTAIAALEATEPGANEFSGTVVVTPGYTDTITSTLSIGQADNGSPSNQQGIHVEMMPNSTILEKITGGGPGIVIYNGSALTCPSVTSSLYGKPSPCQVLSDPTNNVSAMVATQAIVNNLYTAWFYLNGISFIANAGTVTNIADFGATAKPALVSNNSFVTNGGTVTHLVYLHNAGSPVMVNNDLYGQAATGSMLVVQGGETSGYVGATSELDIGGGEIVCPNNGAPIITINGDANGTNAIGVANVNLHGFHTQSCSPSVGSAFVSIHNAANIHFFDDQISNADYTYDFVVTESQAELTRNIFFDNVGVASPTTVPFIHDTTAGGIDHPVNAQFTSITNYGNEAFVVHDYAGKIVGNDPHADLTPDSLSKVFPSAVIFANNVNNQAVDLTLGNENFQGIVDVEVTGGDTNADTTGLLSKRYSLNLASGGTINSQSASVTREDGNTGTFVVLGALSWDSGNARYRIPISAVNGSTNGNTYTVRVRIISTGQFATAMGTSMGLTAIYTLSALTPAPVSFPGVVSFGTGIQFAGAAPSGHYARGNGTNYVDGTIQVGDLPTAIPTSGTGGAGTGLATCYITATAPPTLGHCTSVVGAGGGCTCAAN